MYQKERQNPKDPQKAGDFPTQFVVFCPTGPKQSGLSTGGPKVGPSGPWRTEKGTDLAGQEVQNDVDPPGR